MEKVADMSKLALIRTNRGRQPSEVGTGGRGGLVCAPSAITF